MADACHTISKERDTFISDLRQQQHALQACVLDVAAPHSHHLRQRLLALVTCSCGVAFLCFLVFRHMYARVTTDATALFASVNAVEVFIGEVSLPCAMMAPQVRRERA